MKKTKPTNLIRLFHIQDYCEKIIKLIDGFDADKFEQDERTTLAVTRCIEIIGESAYKMDKEVKILYPSIPWVNIEGMRHRIAHEYYDLDMTTLWRVASVFAPQLILDIQPIILDLQKESTDMPE
jgi:uncharacterized protein with HEPN domain